MKIIKFQDPLTPLSIYVQNHLTPLTLEVYQTNCLPPLSPIDNQSVKSNDYYMLSGLSFRSAFVFSINPLILAGFPLTSFHLAEDSFVPKTILKN